jgi:release factor glutamine methyltransferase
MSAARAAGASDVGEGNPLTLGALVAEATATLSRAGIAEPRRDARLLVAAALGLDPATLFGWPERPCDPDSAAQARGFVARRAAHETPSRILGRREFWSRAFLLSPETLEPRPDSEALVEAALATVGDRAAPLRLLDLGTGTGCLLLALLLELPRAVGVGIDRASGAAATARRNAAALGLASRARFVVGDWAAPLAGPFDLIVANPPYIPSAEIASLAPEVTRCDPPAALDGGADGLDCYRAIAPEMGRLLAAGGHAALEIGLAQGAAVRGIMEAAGLAFVASRSDLSGTERCLAFSTKKGVELSGYRV